MITKTQTLILSLLQGHPKGAYPLDLLAESEGKLKAGSIYAMLADLEDAGLVSSKFEAPEDDPKGAPRARYKITGAGVRARAEFGEWVGLPVAPTKGYA